MLCVDPEKVAQIWPHVEWHVRRGISRGSEDFDQLKRQIFSGLSLLWIAWDGKLLAVCVTALSPDACEIISLGGEDLHSYLRNGLGAIENYARAEGRSRIRIIGRRGWKRLLKDYEQKDSIGNLLVLEKQL